MDVDVVFDDTVRPHLELRQRREGMLRSWLRERRDATRPENAAELLNQRVRIRDVMERVETEDALDAAVGEIESVVRRRAETGAPAGRR